MFHLIREHWKLLFVWGLLVAALAGGASLFFPTYYSAVSQVLIISRNRDGVDPYTQAKSAERIGGDLAQVMLTTDFYSKVMDNTTVAFDRDRFKNLSERNQRKQWQRDVKPEVVYSTSLMRVTVYSRTPDDAANFARAVSQTLTSRGWEYVGGDVALKEVDSPLVSRFPARPNYVFNVVLGFCIGVFLSGIWVMKYKKHALFNR